MIGDTVRDRRTTLRATVTGAMGATLAFVRNGSATDPVVVNADPFTATMEVDAPAGTADDWWRCELTVNDLPRVLTGHIWVAATGEGPVVDAGTDGGVDAGMDAGTPGAATPDGCGCRSAPVARGWRAWAWLAALAVGARRRRFR